MFISKKDKKNIFFNKKKKQCTQSKRNRNSSKNNNNNSNQPLISVKKLIIIITITLNQIGLKFEQYSRETQIVYNKYGFEILIYATPHTLDIYIRGAHCSLNHIRAVYMFVQILYVIVFELDQSRSDIIHTRYTENRYCVAGII